MQQSSIVEPPLPADIDPAELDAAARRDLRGLQKDTADAVARHLVAAGMLVDEDPERALLHARYARRRASRIAVVREAAGIAAYHAGEWNEALGELRAARRMGGGPGHLAMMADIERALGRPERALELARGPEIRELHRADAIELTIVIAGARRDLGELDAAVVALQIPELDEQRRDPWSARLFYAYADNLLAAGRESDALQWFVHAVDADVDAETDAVLRIADLTGEPLPDDGIEFGIEEVVEDGSPGSDNGGPTESPAAEALTAEDGQRGPEAGAVVAEPSAGAEGSEDPDGQGEGAVTLDAKSGPSGRTGELDDRPIGAEEDHGGITGSGAPVAAAPVVDVDNVVKNRAVGDGVATNGEGQDSAAPDSAAPDSADPDSAAPDSAAVDKAALGDGAGEYEAVNVDRGTGVPAAAQERPSSGLDPAGDGPPR